MRHWCYEDSRQCALPLPKNFAHLMMSVLLDNYPRRRLERFRGTRSRIRYDTRSREEYVSAWEPAFGGMPLYETAKFNAGFVLE